ncbi:MAG: UDP-N-acetylmuramoyl-tripeptide--D-alanyl-D-alanine ligase, partial [Clostridiales bacterium]|nr:UDP-N-acetylmuramoyl-tripeptide--D-alanyl-D-alanine ligase [Candidatus Coliplasma equi]
MKLSLSSIAAVVGGKLNSHADGNREVTGFFTDSRVTDKEKLFLGLTGEKTDGNSFVPSVVESGCAAMTDAEYNS